MLVEQGACFAVSTSLYNSDEASSTSIMYQTSEGKGLQTPLRLTARYQTLEEKILTSCSL